MQFGLEYPFAVGAHCGEPLPYHLQRGLALASDQQERTHQHVERGNAQLMAGAAILVEDASDLLERTGRRIDHRPADAADGARKPMPVPESVLLGQSEAALGMALRNRGFSAQRVKDGCVVRSVSLCMRVSDR